MAACSTTVPELASWGSWGAGGTSLPRFMPATLGQPSSADSSSFHQRLQQQWHLDGAAPGGGGGGGSALKRKRREVQLEASPLLPHASPELDWEAGQPCQQAPPGGFASMADAGGPPPPTTLSHLEAQLSGIAFG